MSKKDPYLLSPDLNFFRKELALSRCFLKEYAFCPVLKNTKSVFLPTVDKINSQMEISIFDKFRCFKITSTPYHQAS